MKDGIPPRREGRQFRLIYFYLKYLKRATRENTPRVRTHGW
jgi:hypothetical protein